MMVELGVVKLVFLFNGFFQDVILSGMVIGAAGRISLASHVSSGYVSDYLCEDSFST